MSKNAKDTILVREETVLLDKLGLYDDIQMRVKLPQGAITAYAKAMESGSAFDSIKCAELDGELIVYDGFLRKKAYIKAGITRAKVTIRMAGSRDEVVLWAVQANAYQCLARSNEDKQRSVLRLLNTEISKTMSNVDIAKAAGVAESYVRKVRQTKISIAQCDSDSQQKVKTSRGDRPRTYNTKKKTQQQSPKIVPHLPKIVWPTREQTGAPPPELENQRHPDHPGMTYRGVHIKEHGITPLFTLEEKKQQNTTEAVIKAVGLLRLVSEGWKERASSITKMPLPDLLALLGTKKGSVSLRHINQVREDLDRALLWIREFLDATAVVEASKTNGATC
jgi:hypothetical protein